MLSTPHLRRKARKLAKDIQKLGEAETDDNIGTQIPKDVIPKETEVNTSNKKAKIKDKTIK